MILLIYDMSKPLETVIENKKAGQKNKWIIRYILICNLEFYSPTLTILFKSLPLLLKTDGKALKGGDETPRL